jgi:hypothetical protein
MGAPKARRIQRAKRVSFMSTGCVLSDERRT